MRAIKQYFEIYNVEGYDMPSILKQVEKCSRVSYKSEDKITEESYKKFFDMLCSRGHYSPLEFGSIYLTVPLTIVNNDLAESSWDILRKDSHTKVDVDSYYYYFSTNLRVITEYHLEETLKFLTPPTQFHDERITVKFVTNRAISHELVRHRVFSFIQESQRYCNYSKEKFGNEVTFITPNWLDTSKTIAKLEWNEAMMNAEASYILLLQEGLKPQQARVVLPNSCKTEICMCGFKSDWDKFFALRDSPTADPQMQDLVKPLHELTIFK
jgi:thymidylate synthase (FAD)